MNATEMTPVLRRLLATLEPRRNPGVYVFAVAAESNRAELQPIATFREREGLTLIVEESRAAAAGLDVRLSVAWLTLDVRSRLDDVGMTAAVAGALAAARIPCNVVAAVHHDHLFVPVDAADAALAVLRKLRTEAAG
jgi:uncharacterized protein